MRYLSDAIQPTFGAEQTYFVRSYAKINLTLDVLGRRSDGYHELITIMQTVDLNDTICLTATEDTSVRMICTHSELSNDDNLAARAAQAIRQRLSLTQGLDIELHKRIPVAAGLGGGSSNAAAVLLALRQWWQLPLSTTDLQTIAAALGSDVPFFLTEGLALCEGRGERITPLAYRLPPSMRWIMLVKPAISVSTAVVFRNLTEQDYSDGTASRSVLAALAEGGNQIPLENLHNSLEHSVLEQYPQVAQAREDMLRAGVPYVRLSGSGPTLFSTFSNLSQAAQVQQQLHAQGYEVYLTHAVYPDVEKKSSNITKFAT
jgi:4-diphosphocytidyl-2-C-methyl-D-erythritol kinase